MKNIFKEAARWVCHFIYRWLPKFDYAVVYGWPDYEDNVLALQEGLQRTRLRRVVLLVGDCSAALPFALQPKVKSVRKNSLAGGWYFLFARYVFFTHRCFMRRFPPNVVSVNLWHGMPVKRIGWMLEGNEGIASRFALATSEFWRPIMQQAMQPFDRTLVCGLPRNDRLFIRCPNLCVRVGAASVGQGQKIIVWLPTYRESVTGELRNDGHETGSVFAIDGISADLFNQFLRQNNAFAFVKPHPMASFPGGVELSHLRILDDHALRLAGVSLHELLGMGDVLITDISGAFVDYLLLDRPIIHSFSDMSAYRASRGFSFEPVSDILAGPLVESAADLFEVLRRTLDGEDSHQEQRGKIRKRFHDQPDGGSTRRLLEQIGLLP
jgi:CDP-glycerol glycerophosphotransferase (TagB/SpsB family)